MERIKECLEVKCRREANEFASKQSREKFPNIKHSNEYNSDSK